MMTDDDDDDDDGVGAVSVADISAAMDRLEKALMNVSGHEQHA